MPSSSVRNAQRCKAMSLCIIMPTARADLQQIHDNTGRFNPENALRLVQRIEDVCHLLADYPYMGIERSDLGTECRSFAVPGTEYIVAYLPIDNGVEVIRVRHGSQNFRRLFQQ